MCASQLTMCVHACKYSCVCEFKIFLHIFRVLYVDMCARNCVRVCPVGKTCGMSLLLYTSFFAKEVYATAFVFDC